MSAQTKTNPLGFLLLLLASAAVYAPAWDGDFLWDDDSYVTENRTLTEPGGLRAIWFTPGATTQYYPLVHTTYWIESRLWGFDSRGYHIVNILLHAISAMLVGAILRRFDLPGAFAASLLFAVHPVCVESVAWITERKNVLSLALALGSMLTYFRHREKGGAGLLAASGALFLGALLAKTVVASLPAVIAVVIWWREGRVPRRDALRLAPLFAIGACLGLFTV
ncbi:MAG: O-GlcNAc transferase, partial [Gemmatimonadetes bacterium]|nr:O-GlcNAc transferase [Gemmatimonadota bacterium]